MKEGMSRKQRHLEADARRKEISVRISQIVSDTVKSGKTLHEGFLAADRWAAAQLLKNPGEKSMYVDAAREYMRLSEKAVEKTNGQ